MKEMKLKNIYNIISPPHIFFVFRTTATSILLAHHDRTLLTLTAILES